jgi:hypothetical protein
MRLCCRPTCGERAAAVAMLYYAERTVVMGPLGPQRAVSGLELCGEHMAGFSVPRLWTVQYTEGFDPRFGPQVEQDARVTEAVVSAVRSVLPDSVEVESLSVSEVAEQPSTDRQGRGRRRIRHLFVVR